MQNLPLIEVKFRTLLNITGKSTINADRLAIKRDFMLIDKYKTPTGFCIGKYSLVIADGVDAMITIHNNFIEVAVMTNPNHTLYQGFHNVMTYLVNAGYLSNVDIDDFLQKQGKYHINSEIHLPMETPEIAQRTNDKGSRKMLNSVYGTIMSVKVKGDYELFSDALNNLALSTTLYDVIIEKQKRNFFDKLGSAALTLMFNEPIGVDPQITKLKIRLGLRKLYYNNEVKL